MNWLSLVESYLSQKRQMGYSLVSEGRYLKEFALYATDNNESHMTVVLALRWANLAVSGSDIAIARRFSLLRPFSRYLVSLNYDSNILPSHYIGPTHRRLPPYIYSETEIHQLMNAAYELSPINGLRPATMATLIGLLVSTGIRPGEGVRLLHQDVDLNAGEILIHNSKGWNKRKIPIPLSTVEALKQYTQLKKQFNPLSQVSSFFEFEHQQPLNIRSADYAFQVLRESVGLSIKINDRCPRLYDLRHTFVCKRLLNWYQSEIDIDAHMAQLSHYIGHKKVSDTYWYLSAIPELMSYAAKKFSIYRLTDGGLHQ